MNFRDKWLVSLDTSARVSIRRTYRSLRRHGVDQCRSRLTIIELLAIGTDNGRAEMRPTWAAGNRHVPLASLRNVEPIRTAP